MGYDGGAPVDAHTLLIYSNQSGDSEPVFTTNKGIPPHDIIGRSGRILSRTKVKIASPLYIPPIGSIVLVEKQFDGLLPLMRRYVECRWDDLKAHSAFAHVGKAGTARMLAWGVVSDGGQHPVQVTASMHRMFADRVKALIAGGDGQDELPIAKKCAACISTCAAKVTAIALTGMGMPWLEEAVEAACSWPRSSLEAFLSAPWLLSPIV